MIKIHLHDTLKLAVYAMPAIQRRHCFQGEIACIGTSENELSVCNAVALEKLAIEALHLIFGCFKCE